MSVTRRSYVTQIVAGWETRGEQAVTATIDAFALRLVEGFQSGKSGRIYRRGGRTLHAPISQGLTGFHHASAPGEYPAIDEGNLVASFEPRTETPFRARLSIGGPRAPYAVILEYGGVRLEARPYWSVTLEAVRPEWERQTRAILTG